MLPSLLLLAAVAHIVISIDEVLYDTVSIAAPDDGLAVSHLNINRTDGFIKWGKSPKAARVPQTFITIGPYVFTDSERRDVRSHVLTKQCDLPEEPTASWAASPTLIGPAQQWLAVVSVTFIMRDCRDVSNKCLQNFKLRVIELPSEQPLYISWQDVRERWERSPHRWSITADKTFVKRDSNSNVTNYQSHVFPVTSRFMSIVIREERTCPTIFRVRLLWRRCGAMTTRLVTYPDTTVETDQASVAHGSCVAHSERSDTSSKLQTYCGRDGSWLSSIGHCVCSPGFLRRGDMCHGCPTETYSSLPDSGECSPCPTHSSATGSAAICDCISGFFRTLDEDADVACTRTPAQAISGELQYRDLRQSSVLLYWRPTDDGGGRNDVVYNLTCQGCGDLHKKEVITERTIEEVTYLSCLVTNLPPGTALKFVVHTQNGVSQLALNWPTSQPLRVRTTRPLGSYLTPPQTTVSGREVLISWDMKDPSLLEYVIHYEVQYWKTGGHNISSGPLSQPEYRLSNLAPGEIYSAVVRANINLTYPGLTDFTAPVTIAVGAAVSATSDDIAVAVGAAAVVLLLVLLLCLISFFARRWRKRGPDADCDGFMQTPSPRSGTYFPAFPATSPKKPKTYVDPHDYQDPDEALRAFTREISPTHIRITEKLGGGEFGDVMKGRLEVPGKKSTPVAIKSLKEGASEKNRQEFLTEASIMGQFAHANVIYLAGVVTRSDPIMIVTEFMENGALDGFLRQRTDPELDWVQVTRMLKGISDGMQYLAQMGYVHRDLAARNILVGRDLVCKVADFGLSREVVAASDSSHSGAYTAHGGKIPVRWTAPEAVFWRKFSTASDVWSFGVLMWEVLTFAERPYGLWTNQEVVAAVQRGYRLPPPSQCPLLLDELMRQCWPWSRSERPRFAAISTYLSGLLQQTKLLEALTKRTAQEDETDIGRFGSLELFLKDLCLSQYSTNLSVHGVTTLVDLAYVTADGLDHVGVLLPSHRQVLAYYISSFRQQVGHSSSTDEYDHSCPTVV